jgi:hypothetical protein
MAALDRHEFRIAAAHKTPKMPTLGIMNKGAKKQMGINPPFV